MESNDGQPKSETLEFIRLCFMMTYKLKLSYSELMSMPYKVFVWYADELKSLLEAETAASKGQAPTPHLQESEKVRRYDRLKRQYAKRNGGE